MEDFRDISRFQNQKESLAANDTNYLETQQRFDHPLFTSVEKPFIDQETTQLTEDQSMTVNEIDVACEEPHFV